MSDVNIQTFSGKVNVSNNFTVGSGHLFVDTQNNKVGLNTTTPEANLHVTGNTYISTDISVGGTLTMGTVTVEALHSLDAVTSVGNTTPHTVEFQNTDTSLVASGNVQANYFIGNGSELSNISLQQVTDAGNTTSNTLLLTNTDTSLVASGNVEVGTANLFVDTVSGRVGVGTVSPTTNLDVNGSFKVNGPHSYSGRPVAVVGRAVVPNGRVYTGIYTFNTILYNDGNIYDTSNGRFTIPTGWDGYYLLMFTGLGGEQESAPNTRWRVNGTNINWGAAHVNLGSGVNFATNNARVGLSTQLVYYLNANDYVQLAVHYGSLYGDATPHSTATVMYLGGN